MNWYYLVNKDSGEIKLFASYEEAWKFHDDNRNYLSWQTPESFGGVF